MDEMKTCIMCGKEYQLVIYYKIKNTFDATTSTVDWINHFGNDFSFSCSKNTCPSCYEKQYPGKLALLYKASKDNAFARQLDRDNSARRSGA